MSELDNQKTLDDEYINQMIRSAFLSQSVFAKIQFDNAKDTTQLIAAANENAESLVAALRHKVQDHKEEIIQQWIEEQL